jgi:hypothetical protein
LGAILLRYLFLLASRRHNREPFFFYIDECHRYLTGDVPNLLAEMRKYGIAVTLAHQFSGQLGRRDDLTYQALMNSTEIKVVFRVKSPEEAQALAEMVIPFNLELPVQASIRPTAVGQSRTLLQSQSSATQAADTEGRAITESEAEGTAHSTSEMRGRSTVTGQSLAVGDASSAGITASSASGFGSGSADQASLAFTSDPNSGVFAQQPLTQVDATGTALSASSFDSSSRATSTLNSHSVSRSTSSATAETASKGLAETHSVARGRALSSSAAHTRGQSQSSGWSEGFETIFEELPTAFHSLENVRYMAGESIRALPIGRAFVFCRGKTACITVPLPKCKR